MSGDERFLVLHDYGMGGLWWWIRASSPLEIRSSFAEVEVISDPETLRWAEAENLTDLTVAEAAAGPLAHFHERRQQHQRDPSFGRLFGKERVYLRLADSASAPGDGTWYVELDPTGRRLRQVQIEADGTATATSRDDWPFNPPYDLGDPSIAEAEVDADEFEELWGRSTGSASS